MKYDTMETALDWTMVGFLVLMMVFMAAFLSITLFNHIGEPQREYCRSACGDDYVAECSDTIIKCRKKVVVKE